MNSRVVTNSRSSCPVEGFRSESVVYTHNNNNKKERKDIFFPNACLYRIDQAVIKARTSCFRDLRVNSCHVMLPRMTSRRGRPSPFCHRRCVLPIQWSWSVCLSAFHSKLHESLCRKFDILLQRQLALTSSCDQRFMQASDTYILHTVR